MGCSALYIGMFVVSGISFMGIIAGGALTSSPGTYTAGIAVLATSAVICVIASGLAGYVGYMDDKGKPSRPSRTPQMQASVHNNPMHVLFEDAGARLIHSMP